VLGLHVLTSSGVGVFALREALTVGDGRPDRIAAGQRIRLTGTIENPLLPGRYFVHCSVARTRSEGGEALQILRFANFEVHGAEPGLGIVSVRGHLDAAVEPAPEP